MGLLANAGKREIESLPASRATLELLHKPKYLDALKESEKGKWELSSLKMGIGGPETPIFKGMYDYGALACGATIKAAQMLLAKKADVAFNPFGGFHHAGPALAAGFCYINDVVFIFFYILPPPDLDLHSQHEEG